MKQVGVTSKLNIPIYQDFLPEGHRLDLRKKGIFKKTSITIHNNANSNSNAFEEREWLDNKTNKRTASYNAVIDDKRVIEVVEPNFKTYHSGNTEGNNFSYGIEICESGGAEAEKNAIDYITDKMIELGISPNELYSHHYWNKNKYCPRKILPRLPEFKKDIIEAYELKTNSKVPQWKKEGLENLSDIIKDREYWMKKLDEPMPVWAVTIILGRIYKELSNEIKKGGFMG